MKLHIHKINDEKIAEVVSDGIAVHKVQDMLDIMADANYQGAINMIINESNIVPDFFNLKTRLAG